MYGLCHLDNDMDRCDNMIYFFAMSRDGQDKMLKVGREAAWEVVVCSVLADPRS